MKRTNKRLFLCYMFLVLNVALIWGNSLLPGDVSGAISGWVRDLIARLLGLQDAGQDVGHGLLRKLAHFTEFACLGGLLAWLFAMLQRHKLLSLGCGFLVACADETIQRFVPGRGPSFRDVLIDTSGVITGIVLLLAGYTAIKAVKRKTEDTKT